MRQATLHDVELLDLWRSSPRYTGEFNYFGEMPRPPLREAIRENGLIGEHSGTLIVERLADRQAIGLVSWHAVRYGPNPESVAWNIGISLIPEARFHGYGGPAQRLLAEHLLATTAANRVEASTDIDNVAEQRALEKAGFLREGVLRGAQYRAGRWRDLVSYSLTRDAISR